MKKLSLGITILAFILIASPAMAVTVKVPKNLCFTAGTSTFQLAMKSLATIPTSGGKFKMYEVTGYANTGTRGPVHGSGYVTPNTSMFHASYVRQSGDITYLFSSFELLFDLATKSGTIYMRFHYLADSTTHMYEFTPTDCSSLAMPAAMPTVGCDEATLEYR